ncbi:MAG TPA: 16S rRNA (cytidine(1402)-2'-O)-methyltransferase [Frankiaceae bacterium]|jgi:16S rRNA (cytidine1402-2'-O)-methyltransferase|nr:16S rRNA (cytidine(1402)-2'-O)-methyltransferase [Frankiaceae bacterium]
MSGRLVLCGAPIGNVADASPRLARTLAEAGVVAAEDTRRLLRLARELDVRVARVVSYHDANESSRTPELLRALEAGETVALVTDAGMPGVSDPGYRLVAAAVAAGVDVTVVPGPSAVTAAVALSGLPSDRWCMEGFLPRKAGERRTRLADLADERRTLVLFEAPHRLAATLADLAEAFGGDRRAVACRELTKTYEEVRRGTLGELAEWAAGEVRGELTLVVEGAAQRPAGASPADLADEVASREAAGSARKDAIAETAKARGLPKREVYDAVVAARPARPPRAP